MLQGSWSESVSYAPSLWYFKYPTNIPNIQINVYLDREHQKVLALKNAYPTAISISFKCPLHDLLSNSRYRQFLCLVMQSAFQELQESGAGGNDTEMLLFSPIFMLLENRSNTIFLNICQHWGWFYVYLWYSVAGGTVASI